MATFAGQKGYDYGQYVETMPYQEANQLGMYKQQLYDQNIQKIYSGIEQTAALPLTAEVDKQYLQQSLNNLQTSLKKLNTADFSKNQVVNSVAGMTSKISKDKYIQAGVMSTMHHQNEMIKRQTLEKEGRTAIENDWEYDTQFQQYANRTELARQDGTPISFGKNYTPHVNVLKKLSDVAKEVGLNSQDVQQMYQTDNQGNVLMDVNGHPKWNPVMVEKTLKGKDKNTILNAFQNALTPDDYNQLNITGRYINRGISIDQLIEKVNTSYDRDLKFTNYNIQDVKLKLIAEEAKQNKDLAKIAQLKQDQESWEKALTGLEQSKKRDINEVTTNPEAVKANMYTSGYLTSMAKAFSSSEESTKYSVSPLFTVTMEQNRFNRDLQRDKISDYHWSVEQKRADKKFEYEQAKDALEFELKYGKKPGQDNRGLPAPIDIKNDPFALKNQYEDSYGSNIEELNKNNTEITVKWFKDANPKLGNETEEKYNERIKKAIYEYASANKEIVDPNSGSINTFTQRFAAKQIEQWKKDPSKIPLEYKGLIERQEGLIKTTALQQSKIKESLNYAKQEAKKRGLQIVDMEDIKKQVKPVSITVGNKNIQLSSSDIVDFASTSTGLFSSKEDSNTAEQATKRLKAKFGNDYMGIINTLTQVSYGTSGGTGGGGAATTYINPELQKATALLKDSRVKNTAKLQSEYFQNSGLVKQPLVFPVMRGKENRQDKNAEISTIFSNYKGNLNETPDFDEEEIQKILLSDNENAVRVKVIPNFNGVNNYILQLTSSKDGKTKEVTINEQEAKSLTGNRQFINSEIPEVIQHFKSTNNKTTNLSGSNNWQTSYYPASAFINLKLPNTTVNADYIGDAVDPNKLWLKMYIHDNKTNKLETITFPQPQFITNPDGSVNQNLDNVPKAITANILQQIRK